MRSHFVLVAMMGLIVSPSVNAQATGSVSALPPVREVNVRLAESALTFQGRIDGKVLSDGRVVVNVVDWRKVYMLDPTLADAIPLFDSRTKGADKYPTVPSSLFLASGDTVWIGDMAARQMWLIGPSGQVARRQPFQRAEDIVWASNLYSGFLISPRGQAFFTNTLVPRASGAFSAEPHDSLYLVRLDLRTRKRDTLGFVLIKTRPREVRGDSLPGRGRQVFTYHDAFESGDAMAMNTNGDLAIVRASDFHVDWLSPSGAWRSTPPIPWPWHVFSAAEKDSIAAARNRQYEMGRMQQTRGGAYPEPLGLLRTTQVADTEPAFVLMSAIPDLDGRIWIQLGARSLGTVAGPPTWAAIDSTGQMVDRFSLPRGRRLIGFDKAGHIYAATDSPVHVEVYKPR